jgi:UDP-N-acetylmuramate--alanine ligase
MSAKKLKIHFIGIGGIGVSALARYYLGKSAKISGSDLAASEITESLKKLGVKIYIGSHNPKCLTPDVKQVVYSPAVLPDNPEIIAAKKLGIQCLSYPQALGDLTKKHFTIAVAGSHGKSTVAAMIGILLMKAGLDPTVIVGTKVKEFAPHQKNGGGSNCRVGKSKYLVIEADEHFASFLNYWPKIIVLTTLEPDHLDYYKNFKNYVLVFKKFISHLPKNGILVVNKDDKNILKIKIQNSKFKIQNYSLKQSEAKKIKEILKVPGEFNVSNALAALTIARILKIPDKISFKALSEYKGSWRRFDIKKVKINNKKLIIINDYGHHPTQIKVTLKAAREKFPKRKIWCLFQPHQYQRTYYLWNDFVKVLKKVPVDKLIITDIYEVAGREDEKIKEKINSKKLIETINQPWAIYLPTRQIENFLKRNLEGGEVVIIMGAGDIYEINSKLKMQNAKL